MSTDDQQTSLKQQRTEITKYAKQHDYKIKEWYQDPGITGDSVEGRLDFCRMLDDSVSGDFEAILLWKQNRFGRFSPLRASHLIYPLTERGQYLVTIDRGVLDLDKPDVFLMFILDQHKSKEDLLSLSSDVCRGMKLSRENASWIGSAPHGYEIDGTKHHKNLVVGVPAKVEVVQRIFRGFIANGGNLSHVADSLNKDRIPTPRGAKKWRFDSVKSILENQAYCGDYVSGKQANGKYNTIRNGETVKSNGRQWNDPDDWVVHKNTHEAIIDRKTFNQAQRLLAKNKTGKPPKTDQYLFHGLLYCGRCRAQIWGDRCDRGGVWYECSNRKNNGVEACKGTKVKESDLGKYIADYLKREYLDDWNGKDLIDRADDGKLKTKDLPDGFFKIRDLIRPKQPKPKRNLDRLKKQRDKLASTINKMKRQLSDGLIDDEFLRDHQDSIKEKKSQLSKIEAELNREEPTEDDINKEVLDVYNSLCVLCMFLRSEVVKASDSRITKKLKEIRPRAIRKRVLPALDKIVVMTTMSGGGTRTRHSLDSGEIVFAPPESSVGSTTGNLNPHHRG